MFINANSFFYLCETYRMIYIAGRPGAYKTSLAFRVAAQLMERNPKMRLTSNTQCVWREPLEEVALGEDGMVHMITVLDEGGLYLEDDLIVRNLAAMSGKLDCIFLIPSFWEPHPRACRVMVEPAGHWFFPFHLIVYNWVCRQKTRTDKGSFYWLNPEEIYGVYSRQDPGATATDIIKHVSKQEAALRRYHGHVQETAFENIRDIGSIQSMESGGRAAYALSAVVNEAAEDIRQAGIDAAAMVAREAKRSRKFRLK